MLDPQAFKSVIENTPLVSIDLCLICTGQIFLGKRRNEPLKGRWFTPGGRIHKNETWQDALLGIPEVELGWKPSGTIDQLITEMVLEDERLAKEEITLINSRSVQ